MDRQLQGLRTRLRGRQHEEIAAALVGAHVVAAVERREGARIAAVIIEPVPANHGLLLQRREFLAALGGAAALPLVARAREKRGM